MAHYQDSPMLPRRVDRAIAKAHGQTVALEATREELEAGKSPTTPSLKEIIDSKTRENGRLREELAYLQQLEKLGENLREELEYVMDRLRMAIVTFRKGQRDIRQGHDCDSIYSIRE
ncbi:hypothetical protein B0T10DRAFT_462671 [Thelonectria olida]|uniref:Uncharacterized protein n=1 Tax=Thelonectria olida TaxID=1576542 RepID=A0A9P8VYE6_9HYPO|nr:hypothetical protein B0T10DRAFT_462671 [Thelonectria olida]